MSKVINVEVTLDEVRGDQNKLIKRFIKKVKKSKILERYREKLYYEKPSDKKRRKKKQSANKRR
jgi:ribosomal protein S21